MGDSCRGFGARESPLSSSCHCGSPELQCVSLLCNLGNYFFSSTHILEVCVGLACVMCMPACVPFQLERYFLACVYSAGRFVLHCDVLISVNTFHTSVQQPIGKVCVTQRDVEPKAATAAALTTKITVTAKAKQVSPSSIGPMMLG